jgi:hypothetical protein
MNLFCVLVLSFLFDNILNHTVMKRIFVYVKTVQERKKKKKMENTVIFFKILRFFKKFR